MEFWSSHNGKTTLTIYQGDALEILREMPGESVHCVVTSPPYWGLRNYGVEGQIGLEKTHGEYVEKMVEVFREVRRVLRRDGTCWLNMGDSYASGMRSEYADDRRYGGARASDHRPPTPNGIKPKDLLGMPWRVVFALQADGWWLRSDIIWSKPNPMPESVTDRPTKAHEYVFLLAKAERYFYDADAIREESAGWWNSASMGNREDGSLPHGGTLTNHGSLFDFGTFRNSGSLFADREQSGRNRRTVWEIATEPFPEAHFATYPQKLVESCILAGTSEKGCCPECGAPWERIVEVEGGTIGADWNQHDRGSADLLIGHTKRKETQDGPYRRREVGWQPTCTHGLPTSVPCTVLDPFCGSGTTLFVAQRLGRNGIGIELKADYCALAVRRIEAEHAQMRLPV
jgi:DNA modification methylase